MASHLEAIFPNLAMTRYEITSPATSRYNCIAWAATDTNRWWWPDPLGIYFWPENVPRTEAPASFVEAFRGFQYEPCGNDDSFEDIQHALNALDGAAYGSPLIVMKRLADRA
jgi:hypothetical protein